MLKIYGSMLCKDCVACCADLNREGVAYEFLDFASQLSYLKEFLIIRDQNPLFAAVKEQGGIGIPCILEPDGSVTLDWAEYVGQDEA